MGTLIAAYSFVKGSKVLQYVLLAAAIAGSLWMVKNHLKQQWKEEGKAEQKQEQQSAVVSSVQSDRTETTKAISDDNATIAKGSAIVRQADPDILALRNTVQQLAKTQADIIANVQKVPEAKLHDLNRALLNGDQPPPTSACYPPNEERAISTALQAYPVCKQTFDKQTEEQKKTDDKIGGLQTQVDGLISKYDHLAGYTGRLEGAFTTLVNLYPGKKRGAHCLWMKKCNKVVLPVPRLADLK